MTLLLLHRQILLCQSGLPWPPSGFRFRQPTGRNLVQLAVVDSFFFPFLFFQAKWQEEKDQRNRPLACSWFTRRNFNPTTTTERNRCHYETKTEQIYAIIFCSTHAKIKFWFANKTSTEHFFFFSLFPFLSFLALFAPSFLWRLADLLCWWCGGIWQIERGRAKVTDCGAARDASTVDFFLLFKYGKQHVKLKRISFS